MWRYIPRDLLVPLIAFRVALRGSHPELEIVAAGAGPPDGVAE